MYAAHFKIDQKSSDDPVFARKHYCLVLSKIGVRIVLKKNLSMGMPVPTVAALACS